MTLFEIKAKVAGARKKAEVAADYSEHQGWYWSVNRFRELACNLNALENELAQTEEDK